MSNSAAVPSLSILGAAKGDTTDLYYLMKALHSGAHPNSSKEQSFASIPRPFSAARVRCAMLCPKTDVICHNWRA